MLLAFAEDIPATIETDSEFCKIFLDNIISSNQTINFYIF